MSCRCIAAGRISSILQQRNCPKSWCFAALGAALHSAPENFTGATRERERWPLSARNCRRYDDRDSTNAPDYPLPGGERHGCGWGGPAPSIFDAVQIPVNDPMMVVPIMAAVTEHIGFGVTANLTYEPPYLFARRMSTLDHLTRGRIGWNIVTGYLDSAARGMGLTAQPDHDGRYDAADEYMSVVYQLWEASWEDGAVRPDKKNRIFADPAKIHRVRHHGPRYQVEDRKSVV